MTKPKPTPTELLRQIRKTWRPKMPEKGEMCSSCPFRQDNDKEFGDVAQRLQKSQGKSKWVDLAHARDSIREECQVRGDFACHGTVYNRNMTLRPQHEHRQCAGAAVYYRSATFQCWLKGHGNDGHDNPIECSEVTTHDHCSGCGHYICENHSLNLNLPFGSHDGIDHLDPDDGF